MHECVVIGDLQRVFGQSQRVAPVAHLDEPQHGRDADEPIATRRDVTNPASARYSPMKGK